MYRCLGGGGTEAPSREDMINKIRHNLYYGNHIVFTV